MNANHQTTKFQDYSVSDTCTTAVQSVQAQQQNDVDNRKQLFAHNLSVVGSKYTVILSERRSTWALRGDRRQHVGTNRTGWLFDVKNSVQRGQHRAHCAVVCRSARDLSVTARSRPNGHKLHESQASGIMASGMPIMPNDST